MHSNPKTLKALSVLFLTLSTWSLEAAHYRVYLIGGQSNAGGRGDASELTAPLSAPQTDVRFYWHKTQVTPNGNLTQDTWLDLQPDSGHGVNYPSSFAVEFGSELSFGRAMADALPSVNVAIIKYSEGGTDLANQWASGGFQYTTFIATVQAGLAALTEAGHTYEPGGMVWIQGEADAASTGKANAYETNLTNLIERIRDDVFDGQTPDGYTLPFVITRLSDSQYDFTITTPGTGQYTVRQAQETVATAGRQTALVDTDGFSTYAISPPIHFDATGQIAIGQACAAQMLALEANDVDRDGLLNDEETTLGTSSTLSDSDADGQTDSFEVWAGTDPVSASSFFTITNIALAGDELTLNWPSKVGNTYDVNFSTDLEDWSIIASSYPATDPGSATAWVTTLSALAGGGGSSGILARYDAQTNINGDFNTTAFDSVDTDTNSTASRLSQGGSLTGGGAAFYVLDNAIFDSSESGAPGFNFAGVNVADQSAAASAGDFFAFTISSTAGDITYESLSFYANQYGTGGKIDISYAIDGGSEVFVTQGLVPTTGNVAVTQETIDFADFTTADDVTWSFYLYGASSANYGTRFDDLTLIGNSSPNEPNTALDKGFFKLTLVQ